MYILPCCDVSSEFKAAKTINPIRIPPTNTPVNKNNHHLSLIVERWVHRVASTGVCGRGWSLMELLGFFLDPTDGYGVKYSEFGSTGPETKIMSNG